MTELEFRVLLAVLIAADPWPLSIESRETLIGFADRTAKTNGYTDWLDAYHKLEGVK